MLNKTRSPVGLACLLSLAAIAATAAAAEPTFTAGPTVVREGDRLRIDFTVDRPTDVAVYIENDQGQIVRHLAAGVLGRNAPAPLTPSSLAQSLVWDGMDDDCKPVDGAGLRVRVGLGLRAAYDGVAFADPAKSGPNRVETIIGLAVWPDGRVFVLAHCAGWGWWQGSKAHILRRDGSYEKTIKPYPPTLPIERLKPLGAFVNSFGAVNPIFYRPEGISLYPHDDTPHQPAILPGGCVVLANWFEKSAYGSGPGVLAMIDRDGGVPVDSYGGPALFGPWVGYPCLAASSDGKAVYISGLRKSSDRGPSGAVYVAKLPDRGPAELFFGNDATTGSGKAGLNDPRGLAVDGEGHLLICDFGNNRVVVVREKDHSFAGSFDVEQPSWVGVNRRTGAVYVCSKRAGVIKLTGWDKPKEAARLDLAPLMERIPPNYRPRTTLAFALDDAAERPILWIGCGERLLRYEDEGDKFGEPAAAQIVAPEMFWRPASDPTRRLVACRVGGSWDSKLQVLEEATGKVRVFGGGVAGTEGRLHRLGPDGCIYGVDHAAGVIRYTPDGKLKPFEATAKDPFLRGRLPAGNTGTTSWERDFWVDRRNNIYARCRGPEYHGHMTLEQFDQAGHFVRTVLWMVSDAMYGPRVDAQGNFYVMDLIKPVGQPYPEEFNGHLTIGRRTAHWYDWIYGSVVKFGPEGGAMWFAGTQASPVDYEGWRVTGNKSVSGLRSTGGSLAGTIMRSPAELAVPLTSLDPAANTTVTFRLKNDSDGTKATLGYHVVGEGYGTAARLKTIEIKPNSDFTEYTFDMAGEKEWKGALYGLTLCPSDGARGGFAIDWVRIGGPASKLIWQFNAEDSQDKKLPDTLKKEPVGTCAYMLPPTGTVLQGGLWYRPGFSHIGNVNNNDHCHCTGNDFDMDDFGRIFAPDSGRFRVGVLDANGNELTSFGGYGNQDFCGPESWVADPATKQLRPRKADDPKDLASPYVGPGRPQIPFGWIIGVAVTDRCAYVADVINKRVLRVRLDYAAEKRCKIN